MKAKKGLRYKGGEHATILHTILWKLYHPGDPKGGPWPNAPLNTPLPTLMHVTCIAHLLHNCTMRVHVFFKNIDDVVATTKAATIKNKDCKNDFREAGLASLPVPVIYHLFIFFYQAQRLNYAHYTSSYTVSR